MDFQVNEIIDRSIEDYGVVVDGLFDPKDVKVIWVTLATVFIRGFAGVNTVYANQKHFFYTHHWFEEDLSAELLDLIMIIDVASMFLHEFAHIKLRKVIQFPRVIISDNKNKLLQYTNDLNASPQMLAKIKNLPSNYNDFGRCIEEKVFGAAVDWANSLHGIPLDFLKRVVHSIKFNQNVPRLDDASVIVRSEPVLMALDYKGKKEFF